MKITHCKYTVGQIVHHKLFHYRGLIVDIDPCFQGTEEWYDQMTNTQPCKEQPWYHILVDDADYSTYVAEQNLEISPSPKPVKNPMLEELSLTQSSTFLELN